MKREKLGIKELNLYIQDLIYDNRCKEAIKSCDEYLKYYGKDNEYTRVIKYFRAKAYRLNGEFEKAEEEFKELIKTKNPDSLPYLSSLSSLFLLYTYLYRFDDALDLLDEIYKNESKVPNFNNIRDAELNIRKQKNMNCDIKKYVSEYTRKQIMQYDSKYLYDALQIRHMNEKANEKSNKTYSIFNPNIKLSYLIDCVKDNLSNAVRANEENSFDVYYFAVSNVGMHYENNCNFIKVVVIPETNNILAMYPEEIIKFEYNILNCEYDKLYANKEEEKVKTLSRTDKFKKRYNM